MRPYAVRPLLLSALLASTALSASGQTKVAEAPFGKLADGTPVTQYTLSDGKLEVKLITFGARITSLRAPGRDGTKGETVLGFDTLDEIVANQKNFMGAVVGRYGNRIGKGHLALDGKTCQLSINDRGNMLHGGATGFDVKNWTARKTPGGVEFTLVSPDGDMGFPGTLTAHVTYTLTGDTLKLQYSATTDKPTIVNLTNHAYFNVAGSGSVLGQTLMINADKITPTNSTLIPTGAFMQVEGSAFDFTRPIAIGAHIHDDDPQLKIGGGGYDHNFVLRDAGPGMHLAAQLTDPASGRQMTIRTTEPGLQFYSGQGFDGSVKGSTGPFVQYAGIPLETQHFPDSPNEPSFPSTELKPGQTYHSETTLTFTTVK